MADLLFRIELGSLISIVAETQGIMVGHVQVAIPEDYERHHGILGISVDKEYRDEGIGFELISTALERSRKAGLLSVNLGVYHNKSRALHLYEKTGFMQVGKIPRKLLQNGVFLDEIIMSVEL